MGELVSKGWEAIIDDRQPMSGAPLNAPIVDVFAMLNQQGSQIHVPARCQV
jgi:hypothetical protein